MEDIKRKIAEKQPIGKTPFVGYFSTTHICELRNYKSKQPTFANYKSGLSNGNDPRVLPSLGS